MNRCRLHPYDAEDLRGATHRRATGFRCMALRGAPLGLCLREPMRPRHGGKQAGATPQATCILAALRRSPLPTPALAGAAGLDGIELKDLLWRLSRAGLIRKADGWRPGTLATWEVAP